MTYSEGKMIYQVLTNTHTFFTLLNKMENSFKVGEGLENELEQDLSNSKTTHEFLNNFARFKFLPHGYYSNNNAPFDYNEKKNRFEVPKGIERQLKLSASSTGTQVFYSGFELGALGTEVFCSGFELGSLPTQVFSLIL